MHDCESCGGGCSGCSGCGRELVLTRGEIDFLRELGQIPFLPVVRSADDPSPVYPEAGEDRREEMSLLLRCLEKKGLISLDFDKPLRGVSGGAYEAWPIRGSMALTARGQQVLDLLEYQGSQSE